jgi:ADP-ribosylglycohydrolase
MGTAIGDALGLSVEGLSYRRLSRWHPNLDGYHLLFGRGMTSDDTEHSCMLAQAIAVSGGDLARFERSLAWRLRFWLLGLPAGIGLATLRAIVKLWLGFPPRASGVFSAGNGPAMRVALIGVLFHDDAGSCRTLTRAATRITHTDPQAEEAALLVVLAARLATRSELPTWGALHAEIARELAAPNAHLAAHLKALEISLAAGESSHQFSARIGCAKGVSGYINHTVPVALHVWLRHAEDLRGGLVEAVRLGGDTDTLAAVVGALIGIRAGKQGIPAAWVERFAEWPRSLAWMERLARRAAHAARQRQGGAAEPLNLPALLLRNAFFFLFVLAHGFRRLLPPY